MIHERAAVIEQRYHDIAMGGQEGAGGVYFSYLLKSVRFVY